VGCLGALDFEAGAVAGAITAALADYGLDAASPFALAFNWTGFPSYQRLSSFASGVGRACGSSTSSPVVLLIDRDIGASIGRILAEDPAVQRPLICLDGLELSPLDFVDVGQIIEPSGALPVVIKSLLFGDQRSDR
jgi:ethanolamine utilization protein EutA